MGSFLTHEAENQLGRLGYPGFRYLAPQGSGTPADAAELLVNTLSQPDYPARVEKGLPWLVLRYSDQMNWAAVVQGVVSSNFQNRLGFLVAVAKEVSERNGRAHTAATLDKVLSALEPLRSAQEHTLSTDHKLAFEKKMTEGRRPLAAIHWNVWTDMSASILCEVA